LLSIILFSNLIYSQKHKIEGNVYENGTNLPIVEANIFIEDTGFGTVSDKNGMFSILFNTDLPITLTISHIGYENKEIIINNIKELKIFLTPIILIGKDVIIEGVQKHSNREVSSKIEVVELKSIEKRGIRDIGEILTEIEGVNITTTAYGKQTISIRGSNSNEVAVYMDGIKLNNSATGSADLAYIDLTDLNEIEVIKGGSSTLFGAGNFGGVVLLHSKKPFNNSIEYSRGFGITDDNDQDLSIAGNIIVGPFGGYGRYSGKSRLFDGRTLFTSIFGNYGGLLSFKNQELAYKHVDYDKYLEFPSGGIVSSDELKVDRITFFGNILGTTGWDIQYGNKNWTWDDEFYTNITREFKDDVIQYRINKGFKINNFSGSIQIEDEIQEYYGDQKVNDSYSLKSWRSTGSLTQHDKGIASVLRYDIHNPAENLDLLRWEGGIRYSRTSYLQNQTNIEFKNGIQSEINEYELEDTIPMNTYRLGVLTEGKINNNSFQLFFSQGYNNRMPTLNDRFIWADGANQLEEDYRRLVSIYYSIGGSKEIEDQLNKINGIINIMGDELEKEFVNTTEFNGKFLFDDFNTIIDKVEIGAGVFRNNYINKIAYYTLENSLVVPYNTNKAWLNGAEINGKISLFNDVINIDGNLTFVQPSDQEIFPNKPSTTGSFVFDISKNWFHVNVSHIFNGPQYYLHGGVSFDQLQKQQNTNLTISADAHIWLLDATISYSIRNLFSDEVAILSSGTQSGDIFNYYDAHRELINLKISLSER
jgi:outer membrane receptor protein involved in Fe transport